MKQQKTYALGAAAVAAAAAVAIGVGINAARGDDSPPDEGVQVVDFSVPEHELLDDVLAIEAARSAGGFSFSYVPATRPEGLRRLSGGTAGPTVLDNYRLGTEPVQLFVEFAEKPTGTCAGLRSDPGSGLCVKEATLAAAADDPRMRAMTIYVGQVGTQSTIPDDATTRAIRRFWSSTAMVPAAEAGWFTDLVTRARAAPKVRAG
jgi:hypothetical protein